MWTREQYENAAIKIGQAFVASGGESTIHELAAKVAQEAGLNPNGIRTLVRLSNVAAFEGLFGKCADNKTQDRMIEFEVGDPEVVINKLQSNAKEAYVTSKTASCDKITDYYGDIPKQVTPLEKNASVLEGVEIPTPVKKLPTAVELRSLFKRAEDKMKEESKQAEMEWFDLLEKSARSLVSLDSSITARTSFEKNAICSLEFDISPELYMLGKLTSTRNTPVTPYTQTKLATIRETHIASVSPEQNRIIEMVKKACDFRERYTKCNAAVAWITENVR